MAIKCAQASQSRSVPGSVSGESDVFQADATSLKVRVAARKMMRCYEGSEKLLTGLSVCPDSQAAFSARFRAVQIYTAIERKKLTPS